MKEADQESTIDDNFVSGAWIRSTQDSDHDGDFENSYLRLHVCKDHRETTDEQGHGI